MYSETQTECSACNSVPVYCTEILCGENYGDTIRVTLW